MPVPAPIPIPIPQPTSQERLKRFAAEAVKVAATAKRNKKSLTGANFYAERLATLRTQAEIAGRELSASQSGEPASLSALLEKCFSPGTPSKERLTASRALRHELDTSWTVPVITPTPGEEDAIFPLSILKKTGRGDLIQVGRQMNGCFVKQWYDACAVMMRRLLETAIIEAFEACGIDAKVKTPRGDFFQLSGLIDAALAEPSWNLGRTTKSALPKVKDVGHPAAHARRYTTQRSEIEKVQQGYRAALEELLSRANLLKT